MGQKIIWSADDFATWQDAMARNLFGMGREDFMAAYRAGKFNGNLRAKCVASVDGLARKGVPCVA